MQITPNVKFDTIAREWRFKWSPDADKQSLVEAQNVLDSVLKEVKGVKGVKSVQRVVCGGEKSSNILFSSESSAFFSSILTFHAMRVLIFHFLPNIQPAYSTSNSILTVSSEFICPNSHMFFIF